MSAIVRCVDKPVLSSKAGVLAIKKVSELGPWELREATRIRPWQIFYLTRAREHTLDEPAVS